jgi:LmbE family N-acetylglucosaminyl deacetylase
MPISESKWRFHNPTAHLFVPDGRAVGPALSRITHLGIGAHHDDLEFMALHGILHCFESKKEWFGGVTCSNGAGSSRKGPYKKFSDKQMMAVRREEQDLAAQIGRYGVMVQLDYPSSSFKGVTGPGFRSDLELILEATRPKVVYTHNPADKHETHIGVVVAVLEALRGMPRNRRPRQVIGCEVWRDLDWLADERKVRMDVSGREHLAAALSGVFDSQIAGGKRYDLATAGRRAANATFFESHAADRATEVLVGMDLTPLVNDDTLDLADYVGSMIDEFRQDVLDKIGRRTR